MLIPPDADLSLSDIGLACRSINHRILLPASNGIVVDMPQVPATQTSTGAAYTGNIAAVVMPKRASSLLIDWPVARRAVGNHPYQPDFISRLTHSHVSLM